jgi:hypothetical protein
MSRRTEIGYEARVTGASEPQFAKLLWPKGSCVNPAVDRRCLSPGEGVSRRSGQTESASSLRMGSGGEVLRRTGLMEAGLEGLLPVGGHARNLQVAGRMDPSSPASYATKALETRHNSGKLLNTAIPNTYFEKLGVPRLAPQRPQPVQPPCTDPYARWCGRGTPGTPPGAPIPIEARAVGVSTSSGPDHVGMGL